MICSWKKDGNRRRVSYVVALVDIQVCVHVSLVGSVNRSCHAGPCLLERQHSFDIVAVDLVTGHRVDNGRLDTKEGQRGATWLGRGHTAEWCNDVGTGLSLPVCL